MKKKAVLIFLSFSVIVLFGQDLRSKIKGRWRLQRIETDSLILRPSKVNYFLTFDDSTLIFNRDVNTCGAPKYSIVRDTLKFRIAACTEICCDGDKDTLYKYLKYTGRISFRKDTLLIENKKGSFYLVKSR